MPDQEKWVRRVSEWRSSGLTSTAYCEGKPFTAGGLRYWAHQLSRGPQAGEASVRMARVVRVPSSRPPSRESSALARGPEVLVVELGAARVAVRPGFDRETLAAVLEVLASHASVTR